MRLIYTLLLLITTAFAATFDLNTTHPAVSLNNLNTTPSSDACQWDWCTPPSVANSAWWYQCNVFSTGDTRDFSHLITDLRDHKGTISHTPARTCRRHRCNQTSAIYVCNDNYHEIQVDFGDVADLAGYVFNNCCPHKYLPPLSGQFFNVDKGYNVIIAYGNCRHGVDQDGPAMGGPDDPWGPNGSPKCDIGYQSGLRHGTVDENPRKNPMVQNITTPAATHNITGGLQPTDLNTTTPVASGTLNTTTRGFLVERAVPILNTTSPITTTSLNTTLDDPIHMQCDLFCTARNYDILRLIKDMTGKCYTPANTCRRHKCINTSAIYICNDQPVGVTFDCHDIGAMALNVAGACCNAGSGQSGQMRDDEWRYQVIIAYGNCRHDWDADRPGIGPPEDKWGPNGPPKCDDGWQAPP